MAPSTPAAQKDSRASSPLPSRASTPPPPLPAPMLTDLGLSLSSVTLPLSPSHFSSPPASGAFLQPHYLLLCHAQGLDVLPLVSPPAPQPYSLIRRVAFKSVVVMEHRGVLVAIAGRRDGVRVYALEEVKRAVEWRMEMEVKRERERIRREGVKRAMVVDYESRDKKPSPDKDSKGRTLPPFPSSAKARPDRRATISTGSPSETARTAAAKTPPLPPLPPLPPAPIGPPPAYSDHTIGRTNSTVPIDTNPRRARATSVSDVLAGAVRRQVNGLSDDLHSQDVKNDWASSDDEVLDPVTAPSGSRALDERTSANQPARPMLPSNSPTRLEVPSLPRNSMNTGSQTRHRPANLDLSLTRASPPMNAMASGAPPSPTPTLLTLRQALMGSPSSTQTVPGRGSMSPTSALNSSGLTIDGEEEEEEAEVAPSSPTTPTRERISLAEALMESRRSDAAPPGTQRDQDAILINSVASGDDDVPGSPRTSESFSIHTRRSVTEASARRRRRWSVFDGFFQPGSMAPPPERSATLPSENASIASQPEMRERQSSLLSRSQSTRALVASQPAPNTTTARPSTAPGRDAASVRSVPNGNVRSLTPTTQHSVSASSRFIPRIITNALHGRRSEDQPGSPRAAESDNRRSIATPVATTAPAPKLEYVKLPGTKGSVMIKAVETAKKR